MMKGNVVVLAGILALVCAQVAGAAHSLPAVPTGDVIPTEVLGLDSDRVEFAAGVASIPEKLDTLEVRYGDVPDVIEH